MGHAFSDTLDIVFDPASSEGIVRQKIPPANMYSHKILVNAR
jgi:hypothetical protein